MAHPKVAPDHKAPEGQDVRQEAITPGRHRARASAWASADVGRSAIYPSGLSAKLPAESASAEALPPGTRQKAGTLAAGPGGLRSSDEAQRSGPGQLAVTGCLLRPVRSSPGRPPRYVVSIGPSAAGTAPLAVSSFGNSPES